MLFVLFLLLTSFSFSILAANIHQSTLVRDKDIRKFLDGIYVSEGGVIEN